MKRDMGLIQAILEELERSETPWCNRPATIPGYNDATLVLYHLELCVQAGFIRAWNPNERAEMGRIQMTWLGHEHLNRTRSDQQGRP